MNGTSRTDRQRDDGSHESAFAPAFGRRVLRTFRRLLAGIRILHAGIGVFQDRCRRAR